MATKQRKWPVIEAYEHLGATTKDRYAWSAQSPDRSVTVITLWEDEISYDGAKVIADTREHPTLESWRYSPRNKRRIKHLQDVWAGSREFRVIMLRSEAPAGTQRSAVARWPEDQLVMKLIDFKADTGEYLAVGKKATRGSEWTPNELRACVSAYRKLWDAERDGQRLNKSELRRQVLKTLTARSETAYERRMQNISAVMEELGMPYVKGYPPLRNIGKPKGQIIALINEEWQRENEPELPTDDAEAFATRVLSARKKRRGDGLPPNGSDQVSRSSRESSQFIRNPEIAAWVLDNAMGICEGCGHNAPFIRNDGTPYLEVHHVRWLAEGGPDSIDNAIALCPNCHRRLHSGDDRAAFRRKIISLVARIKDFPKKPV